MSHQPSKPAPIVLFAYKRLDTLKATVEALKRNVHAAESELIVYSDAAKNSNDEELVSAVRRYLHEITGFKSIEIREREKNYGLARSIIEGVSEVIDIHEKVIVVEDDLVTSKNFLCYMNQSLDFYEEKDKIFSIAGFTFPINFPSHYHHDIYFSYRASSWGWATWKNRWKRIDWAIKDYSRFQNDRSIQHAFNRGGDDLSRMLKRQMSGRGDSWAIRWCYNQFKLDLYTVYPVRSKVLNIGFGHEATHTGKMEANIYSTILDNGDCNFTFGEETMIDDSIAKSFRYQYTYRNKLLKNLKHFLGLSK